MAGRIVQSVKRLIGAAKKPADGSSSHGPLISYTPDLDGDPDPGEVVWTWVPYEDDPSQGKDRPVLVIGREGAKVLALALSSKDHSDRDDCMLLGSGAWDRSERPSYVKLDRLLRVEPSEMRREGAVLDRKRFDQVIQRATELHDWQPG